MRFLILIVTILFLNRFSFSQNCNQAYSNDRKVTEIYNSLFYKEFNYGNNNLENVFNYIGNIYDITNLDLNSQLGNLEPASYVIESLISMFETTKDKAYLIKAINKSIELINVRGVAGGSSIYTWKGGSLYVPNPPGLVMWAMAHLCHVILYDYPELCNTPLPNNLLIQNTGNYPYTNGIST